MSGHSHPLRGVQTGMKPKLLCLFVIALACIPGRAALPAERQIPLNGYSDGRIFEGIGALSAGASSRLLMEYPEPARGRILDLLFKPRYGAAFHHLKVEIGGDVNSTDGTEPSHARALEESQNPRREHYERGYEWWLMREAKKRNANIFLDILQWGAPGWIGGEGDSRSKFFSQDNADFISDFIHGARKYHKLKIDYCGIWNETPHDSAWIKLLRNTLDRNSLHSVQIVAADDGWDIAQEVLVDKELADAIHVIGHHYIRCATTPAVLQTGKRIWSSEDGPWRGDWIGARSLAKVFNQNYLGARATKTIIWSLISSYYDSLPLPDSGPMKAKEPWSGYFETEPALWIIAHTTQFTQPGWRYLDSACGWLPGGGSYVTLRSPEAKGDYSIIIETMDARTPQTLTFRLGAGLSSQPLHVWTSQEHSQFYRLTKLAAVDGLYRLTVQPEAIYTLTTTSGQRKGTPRAVPPGPFPLPYRDNFDNYPTGKYARYFADQGGVFEVVKSPDGKGQCLGQVIAQRGIDWRHHPTPEPYTMIGSAEWHNYEVKCQARIEQEGEVSIWGRIIFSPQSIDPARGYWLSINNRGTWRLMAFTNQLADGRFTYLPGQWQQLSLRMAGSEISASANGLLLAKIKDSTYLKGMAGLGSGWNKACFDRFSIEPIQGPLLTNLVRGRTVSASSEWHGSAGNASDGRRDTKWNTAAGHALGEWWEVDFGQQTRFNTLSIRQTEARIQKYRILYWNEGQWQEALAGERKEQRCWVDTFPPVEGSKLRLVVEGVRPTWTSVDTVSVNEIEVYQQ